MKDKRVKTYFIILAVLSGLALIPSFFTLMLFPPFTPLGLLLGIAPMTFLFSALVYGLQKVLGAALMPKPTAGVAAVIIVTGLLFLLPYSVNSILQSKMLSLQASDKTLNSSVKPPNTLAMLINERSVSDRRYGIPLECEKLCQYLLVKGFAKRLILAEAMNPSDASFLNQQGWLYYIGELEPCPSRVILSITYKREMEGKCIISTTAQIKDADNIVIERKMDAGAGVEARRLELLKNTPNGLEVLDRKTEVKTTNFFMPLIIGPQEGWPARVWIWGKPIRSKVYYLEYHYEEKELNRLFDTGLSTSVSIPTHEATPW